MDYKHTATKESVRESLIAISYGVVDEIRACLPKDENTSGVTDVDPNVKARNKTIDELRSELISLASFDPSTDYKSDESKTLKV